MVCSGLNTLDKKPLQYIDGARRYLVIRYTGVAYVSCML